MSSQNRQIIQRYGEKSGLGERVLVVSTREPLCDAARVLLDEGASPRARIALMHAGPDHVARPRLCSRASSRTGHHRGKEERRDADGKDNHFLRLLDQEIVERERELDECQCKSSHGQESGPVCSVR